MISTLAGRKLESVLLGDAIALNFSGGCQVLIEAVAHLDGEAVEPGDDASDVLVRLLGDVVREARIREAGELQITFGSGAELVVDVDADAESWAVAGPGGRLVICVAPGELAVWDRSPPHS